jgi:hypothetical protein
MLQPFLGGLMKKTMTLLTLALSLGVFAQDQLPDKATVVLTSEEVSISASEAILVRTNKTPETVEITLKVPMQNSICVRTETRMVVRASGVYCGYDTYTRRVRVGQVCARKNPYNNECLRMEDTFREERVQSPRVCPVPESFCAERGTATSYKTDTVKVTFQNLPALGDSESDTFTVSSRQKEYDGGDVVYEVKPLQTLREYKVTQKKILFWNVDSYVVEEK